MDQISFTDSSGVAWAVREDGADDARSSSRDSQPGATWLRFDSDLEVRRLWHYPDDWRGLNPVQLETLLERSSTVIARFRSVRHPNHADPNPTLVSRSDAGLGATRNRVDSEPAAPPRHQSDDV